MTPSDKIYEKKAGNRIPLYAEIGKYFYPDGTFDDAAFRRSIREFIKGLPGGSDPSPDGAGRALSAYLREIVGYIGEKGMADVSIRIIRIAVEEAAALGFRDFVIPLDQLKSVLDRAAPEAAPAEGKKKSSLDEKREKIFQAAQQVFAEKGYHRATIDEIAALSGIGKGSVYRYFKSKKDLLGQLLAEKYDEIIRRLVQILSRDQDVLLQIQEMIEVWIRFIEENHVVYRLIQNEAITLKGGEKSMFYDFLVTQLPMFKERIVALNREKLLKTTNFYTVFYGILGFIDGVVQKWFRQGRSYRLTEEIPVILEVLFNGFVGERSTEKSFYEPPAGS